MRWVWLLAALLCGSALASGKNSLTWNGSAFVLRDYRGAMSSTYGTTTSGLQELLTLANANGFPGEAIAGRDNPFIIASTVSVIGNALRVTVTGDIFAQNMGAADGILIDTLDSGYFKHYGTMRYSGSGKPVHIRPATASNGIKAVQYSEITLGFITQMSGPTGNAAVHIDPRYGAFNNNKLTIRGINGGGFSPWGILVLSPNTASAPNSCFGQNDIDVGLVTGVWGAAIQEGNAYMNPATMPLGTNKWEVGAITTGGNLNYAFITTGIGNLIRIGSISNNGATTIGVGIQFGAGTFWNRAIVTQNEGVIPVQNFGAATNVVTP